jgi:predicted metal-dependent peptidase
MAQFDLDAVAPEDKLAAARMIAVEMRPYFAAGYHALIPIKDDELAKEHGGTLGVDEHWRMYYNPKVFEKWSIQQVATVLYHELSHLLHHHPERAKKFGSSLQHNLWNIAADLSINEKIVLEINAQSARKDDLPHFELSADQMAALQKKNPNWKPGPLTPPLFNFKPNLMAEEYYIELLDMQDQQIEKLKQILQQIGQDGDGKQAGGAGGCGSCAHGQKQEHEQGDPGGAKGPQQQGQGKGYEAGLTPAEVNLIERKIAKDIKEYGSQSRGSMPEGWDRWAEGILDPQVNYMAWLRGAVRNAIAEAEGRTDYTWTRRSRRQGAYGDFILPGMTSYKPRVGIGIDTSGSMSSEQVTQCVAECKGVLKALGQAEMYVVSCDAAVHTVQKVTRVDQILLKGGGGTDMGAALAALSDIKPGLDLKILLTDQETPWPAVRPKGAIVIVNIEGHGAPPPWPCHQVTIRAVSSKK